MQAPQVERALAQLRSELAGIYGERLYGVYLFGSYARGDETAESDLDVMIVLDEVEAYGREIDRTSQLVARLSLDLGRSISRVFVGRQDWMRGGSSFLDEIRQHAVPL